VLGFLSNLFQRKDPYWDQFVNRPLADPKNMVFDLIAESPGGGVFAVKIDVHDSAAMTGHMVELARFWGADAAGVATVDASWFAAAAQNGNGHGESAATPPALHELPHAIVCGVRRDFDVRALGMGGRRAEQKLAVANFHLRSYLREIGYQADFAAPGWPAAAAASAGLGTVNAAGKLISAQHGDRLVLGQIVLTNIPLQPSAAS
jgi:epoxyqueuosine reductase